jgi:hypothetical protein
MPYGTINVDKVVDTDGGVLAPISSVFRNRIINGAMTINQRGALNTAVTPANGNYTLDRFYAVLTQASKFTVTQVGPITAIPFANTMLITSTSAYSVVSGDTFNIAQRIEGFNTYDLQWGTANAQAVTLSFRVFSSLAGTFGGAFQNSAANRSYPFTYSIPVANTWTTISVTIAGDTTGTWVGATNGVGLIVYFGLGVGSTYSGTAGAWAGANYTSATGATSVVGTDGATFYITGVQLEKGSTATSFDYRPYGTELALCQRYFQKGFANIQGSIFGNGTFPTMAASCKVTMRAAPTVTLSANCIINFFGVREETLPLQGFSAIGGDGFTTTFGPTANSYTFAQPANNLSNNILASAEL